MSLLMRLAFLKERLISWWILLPPAIEMWDQFSFFLDVLIYLGLNLIGFLTWFNSSSGNRSNHTSQLFVINSRAATFSEMPSSLAQYHHPFDPICIVQFLSIQKTELVQSPELLKKKKNTHNNRTPKPDEEIYLTPLIRPLPQHFFSVSSACFLGALCSCHIALPSDLFANNWLLGNKRGAPVVERPTSFLSLPYLCFKWSGEWERIKPICTAMIHQSLCVVDNSPNSLWGWTSLWLPPPRHHLLLGTTQHNPEWINSLKKNKKTRAQHGKIFGLFAK